MALQFPSATKTYRASPYPAISADRPELSVKGQTVLITGGGTGIGFETTKAFAQAGATKIILVARSEGPMLQAKNEVEAAFPDTKVEVHAVSITDFDRINKLIDDAGSIDVLVLNAGILHKPSPVLQVDAKDLETAFQVNVFGPLNMIKAFMKQATKDRNARKTIIYTSAWGVNFVGLGVGGYSASKSAMTYIMRCIAEEDPDSNVRTFSFHPCVAYTPMARDSLGLGPNDMKFDTADLPAHYAVWLCSPEADYLKGRFLSANWDVDELKAKKQLIESDPSLLKVMVNLGQLEE